MKKITLFPLFLLVVLVSYSQGKFILPDNLESDKIRFKLINNLIIIPIEVNGAELSFLLDSGVSKPIVFNLFKESDSLILKNTQTVYLKGLGKNEPVQAIRSTNNVFKIGDVINLDQSMYAIFDENFNFSPRLGVTIHGIMGYDLFSDFVVEIDYSSKYIRFYNPEHYKYKTCKKCETLDLEFHNNKPYFNVQVGIDGKKIPVKLLIDSGGTDALWLFEDEEKGLKIHQKSFEDFLGHGLSGSVYGKRSRIEKIYINNFELSDVNVAFPDSVFIVHAKNIENRNGSFAGNLIKRFNVIMDYPRNKITLKKNKYFKEPFSYNKAGIELEQTGVRFVKERESGNELRNKDILSEERNKFRVYSTISYKYVLKPAYTIVELRKGSPADRIGLKIGDLIVSINNKLTKGYNLQEITQMFYEEENKKIRIKIERNGIPLTFVFRLEDPLK